jgi:hypothetical protein
LLAVEKNAKKKCLNKVAGLVHKKSYETIAGSEHSEYRIKVIKQAKVPI